MTSKQTANSRMTGRLKHIWAEINYANRRMLEIRTGWPLDRARDDERLRQRSRPANAS